MDVERVDAEAVAVLAAVADGRELAVERAVPDDAGEQAALSLLEVFPRVAVLAGRLGEALRVTADESGE